VPFSVPGFPSETASGGIKAPQYFAPGVSGDHGEPVAQFLELDDLLIPNNLTANAHGNGYADPNLMIGSTLEGVTADSGAFNARYGDHAIPGGMHIYMNKNCYGRGHRFEPVVHVTDSKNLVEIGGIQKRCKKDTFR
jgi:hypothetical protein